jgi:hypothetical protein
MEQISKIRRHVSDIQLFQFVQNTESCAKLKVIPWCQYIVVVKGDMRKPYPIDKFDCPVVLQNLLNRTPVSMMNQQLFSNLHCKCLGQVNRLFYYCT